MHFDSQQQQGPVGRQPERSGGNPGKRQGRDAGQPVDYQQNIGRHLRSLPQEMRQPCDWIEFRRRARERFNAAARRRTAHRVYAAIAAALVLVVVGLAAWIRGRETPMPDMVEPELVVEARADDAERWLANLPNEPVVVHVGTRAAVAGLEDRIAQLDDVLSEARVEGTQPAKLQALEEQRTRLVNSLVQVRYAETLVSASR